jgi:anti-sigma regulatory factor (Ser/Thr protein kinase)
MGHSESLEITSAISELERVFAFIDQYCGRAGIPDQVKYKILLIAEELTMNSIGHGYRGRVDGRIGIALSKPHDDVELCFEDESPAYDPLAEAPEPSLDAPLEERRIGGLGIHLLKTLARSAAYSHVDGRNIIRVTLAIAGANAD